MNEEQNREVDLNELRKLGKLYSSDLYKEKKKDSRLFTALKSPAWLSAIFQKKDVAEAEDRLVTQEKQEDVQQELQQIKDLALQLGVKQDDAPKQKKASIVLAKMSQKIKQIPYKKIGTNLQVRVQAKEARKKASNHWKMAPESTHFSVIWNMIMAGIITLATILMWFGGALILKKLLYSKTDSFLFDLFMMGYMGLLISSLTVMWVIRFEKIGLSFGTNLKKVSDNIHSFQYELEQKAALMHTEKDYGDFEHVDIEVLLNWKDIFRLAFYTFQQWATFFISNLFELLFIAGFFIGIFLVSSYLAYKCYLILGI